MVTLSYNTLKEVFFEEGAPCCKGKLLQIVKEKQTSSQNFLSCFPLQTTTLYSDTFCLLPL